MSSLNKVMLIGRLGRDPEIRYLENGAAVAKFSIATSESYKDREGNWQEQTEWHDIIMWRKLAERAEQQLSKGALIFVEGKLTHRKWEDKDGNARKTTEVSAFIFRKLEKNQDQNGYFPNADDRGVNENRETPTPAEDPSDDLPF